MFAFVSGRLLPFALGYPVAALLLGETGALPADVRDRYAQTGLSHVLIVAGLHLGIIAATVMPHVIYLHSSLTQKRIVGANPEAKRKIFRYEIIDITIAMGLAGIINLAMLATAVNGRLTPFTTPASTSRQAVASPRRRSDRLRYGYLAITSAVATEITTDG